MKKRLKMTMSVNDENTSSAANNNNCSKADLDHYESTTDLARSLWPPCPPPPPPPSAAWISGGSEGPESGGPTYTPLVKVPNTLQIVLGGEGSFVDCFHCVMFSGARFRCLTIVEQ